MVETGVDPCLLWCYHLWQNFCVIQYSLPQHFRLHSFLITKVWERRLITVTNCTYFVARFTVPTIKFLK